MTSESKRSGAVAELLRSSEAATDPALALASLKVAQTLEVVSGRFYPALDICETMLLRFQMDPIEAKLDLVTKAGDSARTPKIKATLADICIATAFEAIGKDDYAHAETLAGLAATAARGANDKHVENDLAFLNSEAARCQAEYARLKDVRKTLRDRPDDAQANLAIGKYLCFVKNDWEAGLPKLAKGNDPAFKEALAGEPKEIAGRPEDEKRAGDAWWTLAESAVGDEKLHCQWRAKYWYLKAIAAAKDQRKAELREFLADRIKSVPGAAGQVHIFARVENTERIEIYSDAIQWRSNRGSLGNRIDCFLLGDFKPGEARIIRNCGATRMYSEGVDFSTAQFVVDRKARRGRASMEIMDDHVQVTLSDPPNGKSDLEVTVIFGGTP